MTDFIRLRILLASKLPFVLTYIRFGFGNLKNGSASDYESSDLDLTKSQAKFDYFLISPFVSFYSKLLRSSRFNHGRLAIDIDLRRALR